MFLNTLSPKEGSRYKSKRLGRGVGSGKGKTCGKGHKGQTARAGGYHKVGFEGGQTPLQRRLPKFGFTSLKQQYRAEVRLDSLSKLDVPFIDLAILKEKKLVPFLTRQVKVIASGKIAKAVHLRDIPCTKEAGRLIEAVGGTVGLSV